MEIRNILTFLKIAELLNFTKAASQLGYTQSAVTAQIKQLEDELNTRLFDRIGKNISLTNEGNLFLSHAYKIIKEVEDSKISLVSNSTYTGTITIGTMESLNSVFIPHTVWTFHKLFPKIKIVVKTSTSEKLVDMVMSNEVDMVFFLDEGLYGKRCGYSFEFQHSAYFVSSSKHYLARLPYVSVDDLLKQNFILTEENINYRRIMEESLLRLKGEILIKPYLEIENTNVIRNMVIDGKGISLLPDFVIIEKLRAGELAILKVEDIKIKMWSQLIYHHNKWLTPPMKKFIEILEDTIKSTILL